VPVSLMAESTPRVIRLRCDAPELEDMEEFVDTQFIRFEKTHIVDGAYLMWPYTYTTEEYVPQDHERIPIDELAIRRGAHVEAQDGQVGRVDEFIVDRQSEHITHLVMREGHLWGQRDVTIPVSYIKRIDDDAVYLNIDKASVAELPVVPIVRE
jgi:sporulation protein YlmC with PRC-barrel domain